MPKAGAQDFTGATKAGGKNSHSPVLKVAIEVGCGNGRRLISRLTEVADRIAGMYVCRCALTDLSKHIEQKEARWTRIVQNDLENVPLGEETLNSCLS